VKIQEYLIAYLRFREVVNLSSFLLSPYSLLGTCYDVQNCTSCPPRRDGGGGRYTKKLRTPGLIVDLGHSFPIRRRTPWRIGTPRMTLFCPEFSERGHHNSSVYFHLATVVCSLTLYTILATELLKSAYHTLVFRNPLAGTV
jgi:hypothetical protein